VHPIEWLRAIARSDDLPHTELASEAAAALAALGGDPRGMVPACRRLLDRHPEVGPLWWTCARMLAADDPVAEAQAIQDDFAADQVGLSLALDLPSGIEVGMVGYSPLVQELALRRTDLKVCVVHNGGISFAEVNGRGPEEPNWDLDERVDDLTADMLDRVAEESHLLLVEAWAAGDSSFFTQTRIKQATLAAHRGGTEAWLVVGVGRRLPEPMFRALRQRMAETLDPWLVAAELLTPDHVTRIIEPVKITCPCPPELLHVG
jgi:hypothetical protein